MAAELGEEHVPGVLAAFALGVDGRLSDGPVARGRLGAIWRLDTDRGSWAVKRIEDADDDAHAGILDGAAFQEAARSAGVPTPSVCRTGTGEIVATVQRARVRVLGWVDMAEPDTGIDPGAVGRLVAALHRVEFTGAIGPDPWYAAPVGAARWRELVTRLRMRNAPFTDELDALVSELVALEAYLGGSPRSLRTCHRDLWADNVRRAQAGGLVVFDFDNAGLADPAQELAAVLVEYATDDPVRARAIRDAYRDAGGPGVIDGPQDFAMPIAQLTHIVAEGCRRWLAATTDAARADNAAWVREFLDRPLTGAVIERLLNS